MLDVLVFSSFFNNAAVAYILSKRSNSDDIYVSIQVGHGICERWTLSRMTIQQLVVMKQILLNLNDGEVAFKDTRLIKTYLGLILEEIDSIMRRSAKSFLETPED